MVRIHCLSGNIKLLGDLESLRRDPKFNCWLKEIMGEPGIKNKRGCWEGGHGSGRAAINSDKELESRANSAAERVARRGPKTKRSMQANGSRETTRTIFNSSTSDLKITWWGWGWKKNDQKRPKRVTHRSFHRTQAQHLHAAVQERAWMTRGAKQRPE